MSIGLLTKVDSSLVSVTEAPVRSDGCIACMLGDLTRLPFVPVSMDGVMCFGVMQALAGPDKAVTELLPVARPGGQMWVDALNRNALSARVKRLIARLRGQPLGLRYDDPRRLREMLLAAGASEARIYWIPIVPGSMQRLQPWVESPGFRRLLGRLPWLASPLSHAFLVSTRKAVV